MSDLPDLPAFLRISTERRAAVRATTKALPADSAKRIDPYAGLGGVARRLGYPENPADAIARAKLLNGEADAMRHAMTQVGKIAHHALEGKK